ncbi:MAG: hypothetical protein JNK15_00610, partial [Planctomycetes bacterium]|nr:hypothetical protein [Planctomycetota bacterium]
ATQIVRRELQALFRPRTDVGSTELDLGAGRLTARAIRLADPGRADAALLAIERVDVDVAIGGSLALVDVHAVGLDGVVVECGPRLPAPAALLAPTPGGGSSSGATVVPPIDLRRGTLRWLPGGAEAPLELTDLTATVRPHATTRHRVVLGATAAVAEIGGTLTVHGDADLATGSLDLAVTLAGARLTAATLARIARLAGATPPDLEATATVRHATLRVQIAGRGAAPVVRFDAELGDVAVVGRDLPAIVSKATVQVQGDLANGGSARLRLQQDGARGRLDVQAHGTTLSTDPHVDIHVLGNDLAIDGEVVRALNLFRTGRDIVAALRPSGGVADLKLFLRDPHVRGGIAEMDLDLREVAIAFHGFGTGANRAAFPLPLHKARGRVRLRDDLILLEDVQTAIVGDTGGGTVRLHGRVDAAKPGGEDATLDIHAGNVPFSADLRTALDALLHDGGALYDKFSPVGRTEVAVQIRPRSELAGGWAVEVRPQQATMCWAGFPYRLTELQGSVRASDDGVTFDLKGGHGGGTLAMLGFIPLGSGDGPGFSAQVKVDGLTLDDDLRTAVAVLAPDLDAPWRNAAPAGHVSGQVSVWRSRPEAPLQHHATLDLGDVDLLLPSAPWRAAGLAGRVSVQGRNQSTRVAFDALRGRLEHGTGPAASLALLGDLVFGEAAREDLSFVVRDLELDGCLGDTLESLGALGPGTWRSLAPSGRVDLVCRHHRLGPTADPLHLVVHLLDVRSDAAILPHTATHMTGELTVGNGELRFDDVRGLLGGAEFRCTAGRVHTRPAPDERTDITFTVDCRGMRVDDGVANLFAGPLQRAVLQRQLLGTADLDGLRLHLSLPSGKAAAAPSETTLAGQLRLYDLDVTLGEGSDSTQVHGINGVVSLAESTVSERGGQLVGALRGLSLQIFGQPFENFDAGFTADAERIAIASMTSRCHGGSVRSARPGAGITYLLPGPMAPEGRLVTDLVFENVDVRTFLAHGGWQNPPYSGAASGTLVVDALDGSDVIDCTGRGTLRIERADLGVVPLFTAIYAQLPPADRPRFDGLATSFTVADRAVRFDDLSVTSNILGASGKGTMAFDGYVDIQLTLKNLLGASADPFVMPLIDYLTSNIVTFHLHGYLRDLHAEKRWVTESAPARREVVPMPPLRGRPKAPDF